jgi:M6 family metalloprotease-like protein
MCFVFLGSCALFFNSDLQKIDQVYRQLYTQVNLQALDRSFASPSIVDGVSITYESSNPDQLFYEENKVVVVTHVNLEAKVTLTNVLSINDTSKTYHQVVTIVAFGFDKIFNLLEEGFLETNEAFPNISNNLNFPAQLFGATLLFSSSNQTILSNSGLVNPTTSEKNVSLYVVASKDGFSESRNYHLVVLAYIDVLTAAWNQLITSFQASNPTYPNLTANLSFPSNIMSVEFTYSSSNPTVLSNTGIINRTYSDVGVILTVTMNYNSTKQTKSLNLIVKLVIPDGQYVDFAAYPYANGGGSGVAASPIKLLNDVQKTLQLTTGIPQPTTAPGSVSNVNILVVPIYFTNDHFSSSELAKIQKGFFGSHEDTGWESVASYYYRSSFGKLNINGTVMDPISMEKTTTQARAAFGDEMDYYCMKLLFTTYAHLVDFTNFDANHDNKIDGIYFVYSADYSDMPWWAYMFEYYPSYSDYGVLSAQGKTPGNYMWASVNFFNDQLGNSTTYRVTVNAETFIHESGHVMGLDDYYDYDPNDSFGNDGGLGGADMMDYNNGDHGPFNKIVLGWITPMVVSSSLTIKINKANTSGQALLIPKAWNHSYFSEYLLIDYYTPDSLFTYHLHTPYYANYMFSIAGIRIYHVIATIGSSSVWLNNNTDTKNKLIKYVSAGSNNIATSGRVLNTDLFQVGSTFNWSTSFKWSDNTHTFSSIEVVEIQGDYATIRINY